MQILVIEDDETVAEQIVKGLQQNQYEVTCVSDGAEALSRAIAEDFDALVVDRMLPSMDGLTVVKKLREAGISVPVLFLSALGDVDDRVSGLQAGGDDYLIKPFAFAELLARIQALLRRQEESANITRLKVADLEMDLLTQKVTRAGQTFNLQPREYKLLEYLMRNAGQVVTRTMLLENVWEYHFDPQTNVTDVHISRLRQKIDKGFDEQLLATVRGAGYILQDPDQA